MNLPQHIQLKKPNSQTYIAINQLFIGYKKLLLFYHTHCLGCTGRAIPLAYELQQDHPEIKVLLIHSNLGAFQPTTKDILSIFVDKKSPMPIYIDEAAALYHHFHCEGTPHWIFLNEKGQVENSIFGSQANAQNRLMYMLD